MSTEDAKARLRASAALQRLKAATGVTAAATARDFAQRMPRILTAQLEAALQSGELAQRWRKEVAAARRAQVEEPATAALAVMLAQLIADAAKLTGSYSDALVTQAAESTARAEGIEQALEALE